jgi:anti-sigma B factor antagonist
VTVAGEIDIATAAGLRERLSELAAGGRALVADLDQVRFIDSAGLAALVGAANRAAAHGGSLHVVCARPRVRQLFRLTGLDRRLPSARTLDEALNALMAARGTPRQRGAQTTVPRPGSPGRTTCCNSGSRHDHRWVPGPGGCRPVIVGKGAPNPACPATGPGP